jgi:1,4-dihydroxy-6-naphthoate synthase
MKTTLGFSPCPNDTFLFHALVHDRVKMEGLPGLEVRMADVETLNRLALEGRLDISKVSYGVVPQLLSRYVVLRSGGAMGFGCGPLIVARSALRRDELAGARIAIPGRNTTAALLLRLHAPEADTLLEMPYERIMPAVTAGEVDAGLIIHESRFTFQEHGLVEVVDLGAWWEEETGSPIPLGAIVARRGLGEERLRSIEAAIRASAEAAMADPEASRDYVREHAQEMDEEVMQRHIDLYVNAFSIDVGEPGERAVRTLLARAAEAGVAPPVTGEVFLPRG